MAVCVFVREHVARTRLPGHDGPAGPGMVRGTRVAPLRTRATPR
jgi:hypothetical protein